MSEHSPPPFSLPSEADGLADLKVPPHSIEAEQSVLGGLMVANDRWDTIADVVSEDDFYRAAHRQIFARMAHLTAVNEPIDVVTLAETLNNHGELEQIGGFPYLVELAKNTPSTTNIRSYAKAVRERARLRAIIHLANQMADSAHNTGGRESKELLDDAERQLIQITEQRLTQSGPEAINPLLTKTVERIDTLYNTDGQLTGLSTGFTDLDQKTSGLQTADLVVVAARPSMGKTAFVMNLVEHAITGDKPVIVFSMEMPAEALIMRMISSIGGIDQSKVRTGKLNKEDWPKLNTAIGRLKDSPLFIDDSPALTPIEVRSRTRRIVREHGQPAMIVVDYLQLMQAANAKENRTNEISEISRSLKAIAKEFDCPLIAISQLNRSLEQRPNKRPINSDLRESGAIEQDADLIICLYRDEVYNEETQDKGIAEIIIRKQRNGPIGTVRLAFRGELTRFDNLSTQYQNSDGY